jgi:DNA topoisomerase-1
MADPAPPSFAPSAAPRAGFAREAGLLYVSDAEPGLSRSRQGNGFRYRDASGKRAGDAKTRRRILDLVIPPAWTDVWICSSSRGHIQATGRDERGRKQYIYHRDWVAVRDETKFADMVGFARTLPSIRRRVARDLRQRGIGRSRVLAAVVQLLDLTLIRVGNERYAEDNGTYGLTTLRSGHVRARGGALVFQFLGKNGKPHQVSVGDRLLTGVVRRCQELPGQRLFQYIDENGERRAVTSDCVNDYLREISGRAITAKDFRTWGATVHAVSALHAAGDARSEAGLRRNIVAAVKTVASALRNTAAVCRKSYIHPAVTAAYAEGRLHRHLKRARPAFRPPARYGLNVNERATIALLKSYGSS